MAPEEVIALRTCHWLGQAEVKKWSRQLRGFNRCYSVCLSLVKLHQSVKQICAAFGLPFSRTDTDTFWRTCHSNTVYGNINSNFMGADAPWQLAGNHSVGNREVGQALEKAEFHWDCPPQLFIVGQVDNFHVYKQPQIL